MEFHPVIESCESKRDSLKHITKFKKYSLLNISISAIILYVAFYT